MEVLVSITVLGLMMVGVAQMLNSAINATLGGYKHLDADTQARMVLDRMAFDISKITKRADVDYYFQKNTGNDQMAFYSESGGYYPSSVSGPTQDSDVALVGYRINANNQMERLSKGLIWNGVSNAASPMVFLPQTIPATWPQVPGTGADPDYQVIGDQIFRLEYCFLVENTTASAITAGTSTTTTTIADNPWAPADTKVNGLQDVIAVVVSIAVLDSESRASVSNAALTSAASKLLDDGGTTATLPVTRWKSALISNGLGLPKNTASQVRFYQRYCYINHVQ